MTDMLVKLYDLSNNWSFLSEQAERGVTLRKPFGPEKHLVIDWVRDQFGDVWAGETAVALSHQPVTCFIACQDQALIGFACYDATALGLFGPGGAEQSRGRGTGRALLMACLSDMKLKGYGYTIVGDVGPAEFFRKTVGAVEVPDSTPGLYKAMLRRTV